MKEQMAGIIQRTVHDVVIIGENGQEDQKSSVSIIDFGQGRFQVSLGNKDYKLEIEARPDLKSK